MTKEQKTKKLEQTDIDSIIELRKKYAENTNSLGLITTDEYAINQQLEQLKSEKERLFSVLNELRDNEMKLMDSLKEKYGDGQINIEDGTFTSVS
jgi:c-di-AMP phosphodiesterase-like protein